ncbi:MAG: hypothetical protein ACRD2J_00950 [Thermoanaerobaculia bacterium]
MLRVVGKSGGVRILAVIVALATLLPLLHTHVSPSGNLDGAPCAVCATGVRFAIVPEVLSIDPARVVAALDLAPALSFAGAAVAAIGSRGPPVSL